VNLFAWFEYRHLVRRRKFPSGSGPFRAALAQPGRSQRNRDGADAAAEHVLRRRLPGLRRPPSVWWRWPRWRPATGPT